HDPYTPTSLYELTFSDGEKLVVDGEHQWVTWTHADRKSFNRTDSPRQKVINDPTLGYPEDWPNWTRYTRWGTSTGIGPKVRTTQDIVDTFTYGKRGDLNHSIPMSGVLSMPERDDLLIDPYLFGSWLGDGYSSSAEICGHKDDIVFLHTYAETLDGMETRPLRMLRRGGEDTNTLIFSVGGLRRLLVEEGVFKNKHVPEKYLFSSPDQRQALLAGLLDTDGYISKQNGTIEFCSTVKNLADAVMFLFRSFGERPVLDVDTARLYGKDCGLKYRVRVRPRRNYFRMPRKAEAFIPLGAQASRSLH